MHLVTSDEPLKRADVKAALATKDSQGRRRLLSSVTGIWIYLLQNSPCHTFSTPFNLHCITGIHDGAAASSTPMIRT